MGAAAVVRLLAWSLLAAAVSAQSAGAAWESPKFLPPPDMSDIISFTENTESPGAIIIGLNENAVGVIALVNYAGTTAPNSSKTTDLQIKYAWSAADEKYTMSVTAPCDYDNGGTKKFDWDVVIENEKISVTVNLQNVNDNAPQFINQQRSCSVSEFVGEPANFPGEVTTCSVTVRDADGDADKTEMTVSENGEVSTVFELRKDGNPNADKTEQSYVLYLAKALDYEEYAVHILDIVASDKVATAEMSYVVNVEDLPDQPPVWDTYLSSWNIEEKTLYENGKQVKAHDGDIKIAADISYKLEAKIPEYQQYFEIGETDGMLTIHEIDRDTLKQEMFEVVLTAYEMNDPTSSVEQTLTVIVSDLNDHSPEIKASSTQTKVDESYSGTFDFGITVEDPDLADSGSFTISLVENTWSEAFLVVPATGYQSSKVTISVQDPTKLDYENDEWRIITLEVQATEVADTSHVNSMKFTIELNDTNDEYPEFTQDTFTVTLPESEVVGKIVTTVTATDKDAGDEITYTIMPSTQFRVDPKSGEVTINRQLDYESSSELTMTLTAEDRAGHLAYAKLIVTVTDVNDEAPSIEPNTTMMNLKENAGEGIIVAEITASDPDTEAVLELSIDWDNSFATKLGRRLTGDDQNQYLNAFEIVTVKDDKKNVVANLVSTGKEPKLDWGTVDTIYLMLVVTDTKTAEQYVETKSKDTVQMTITIIDINNHAPEFIEQERTFRVREEEASYSIGFISATDADGPENNDIKFSITGAEEKYNGYIQIDSKTGEMSTIKAIDCDLEGFDKVPVIVTASDGENDNSLTISIEVIDINDEWPIFGDFERTVRIPERSPDDTEIVQIVAKDADRTAPFNTVTYILQATNDNQLYFAVDNETGVLSVKLEGGRVLRREDRETFYIDILVRDNYILQLDDNSNSNQTTITLILDDINDNPPVFPKPDEVEVDGCFRSISEKMKKNEKVGEVIANDSDLGDNAKVSYKITSMTNKRTGEVLQKLLFSVDETSGDVTAAVDLQDLWGEYAVSFYAEDHGSTPLSGSETYTSCVKDVNDYSPEFQNLKDGDIIRLQETQVIGKPLIDVNGDPIADFEVTDKDDPLTGNGQVSVSITGDDNSIFTVQPSSDNTFQLLLQSPLSSTTVTRFELQLTATDNGSPEPLQNTITIVVKIIVLSPQEPKFNQSQWTTWFQENRTEDKETRRILLATDDNNENLEEDDEDYQTIYYYIIGGDEDLFQLDSVSGDLKVQDGKLLDYEVAENHTLTIRATNKATKPEDVPPDHSLLECIIEVIDINDMPPDFNGDLFAGGFTIDDEIDKVILTLNATDPDVDDKVTYEMIGAIEASSDSLSSVKDQALKLDNDGNVILKFNPKDETLDGYFSFTARAKDALGDEPGHYAEATVQVYVISNIHRVTFQFLNNVTDVRNNQAGIEQIFKDVFKYDCGIENFKQSADPSTGLALPYSTDVVAHFIDTTKELPVERDVITRLFYDQDVFIELQSSFWKDLHLQLKSYQEIATDTTNMEGTLTIILIVVSAVLGTMVIVLFVAFFLRTKTLKRRLEALQEIKFGSQNSGLNRVGVAVPNTNKHAVEGSNPMWKTDAVIDYDNVSQGSGDSDMIGIEDNPEFQPSKKNSNFLDSPQPRKVTGILNKEFTFHPDDPDDKLKADSQYLSPHSAGEGQQPRRITETLNSNFILQYDTEDNDLNQKTQSVNPLANGNLSNTDNYEGNNNFSFKPTDSVPVTQL